MNRQMLLSAKLRALYKFGYFILLCTGNRIIYIYSIDCDEPITFDITRSVGTESK